MIEATPRLMIADGFYWYARRLLRRRFDGMYLLADSAGLILENKIQLPVAVVSTHHSWWDVLVGGIIARDYWGANAFAPMDEAQLRRYPILRNIGVFGIGPRDLRAFLRYGQRLLTSDSRALLWVTPQASFASNLVPQPEFKPGLFILLERIPEIPLYLVAIHYDFWSEPKPMIFVAIESAPLADRQYAVTTVCARTQLDNLTARLVAAVQSREPRHFVRLTAGREGAGTIYDRLRSFKARLTGKPVDLRHLPLSTDEFKPETIQSGDQSGLNLEIDQKRPL